MSEITARLMSSDRVTDLDKASRICNLSDCREKRHKLFLGSDKKDQAERMDIQNSAYS